MSLPLEAKLSPIVPCIQSEALVWLSLCILYFFRKLRGRVVSGQWLISQETELNGKQLINLPPVQSYLFREQGWGPELLSSNLRIWLAEYTVDFCLLLLLVPFAWEIPEQKQVRHHHTVLVLTLGCEELTGAIWLHWPRFSCNDNDGPDLLHLVPPVVIQNWPKGGGGKRGQIQIQIREVIVLGTENWVMVSSLMLAGEDVKRCTPRDLWCCVCSSMVTLHELTRWYSRTLS